MGWFGVEGLKLGIWGPVPSHEALQETRNPESWLILLPETQKPEARGPKPYLYPKPSPQLLNPKQKTLNRFGV